MKTLAGENHAPLLAVGYSLAHEILANRPPAISVAIDIPDKPPCAGGDGI